MTFKIFRRGSARCIGLLSAFITILLCLYYITLGQSSRSSHLHKDAHIKGKMSILHASNHTWQKLFNMNSINNNNNYVNKYSNSKLRENEIEFTETKSSYNWDKCVQLRENDADIDTKSEFAKFEFEPDWMKTKEYWDREFESRYEKLMNDPKRPPLKVVIVPHSHNDPGWLKTFVNYFQSDSRQIINLAVTKMPEYKDMTFIWSEMSFLQMWWDQAHPTKQRTLKKLIEEGRFEITTGGWVMTDEANAHVFAMVDQLIEGHQWVKTNLNFTPVSGWSIDPFGHGSTVPYLLSSSGFKATIIQRIHYAWKQWFARKQSSDFKWLPFWANPEPNSDPQKHSMLTHNMPFDIYSIKHSCGPHPFICLNFDFRKIPGEYTEYSIKAQFITPENIQGKADLLMEQYSKTASLFPHNIALIPVGDDFRYNKEKEVDQQYTNYKKLIDYINANSARYNNATVSFGTPIDYFNAVEERMTRYPTLRGDFFVYADIFSEGRPAYWSGYFTTRPFYKLMSRDLEHNLRALEILFTLAFNKARQNQQANAYKIYEKNYEKMIQARRNLGLFQHHDAITGTSKANVMRDYALRLFESIQDTVKMQQQTIELLVQANNENNNNFIVSELERDNFSKLPRKTPIHVTPEGKVQIVLYNSLAQDRFEVISIRTTTVNVKILDPNNEEVSFQINPVFNVTEQSDTLYRRLVVSDREYEVLFLAKLPGLSLSIYTISYDNNTKSKMSVIYCEDCKDDSPKSSESQRQFEIKNKQTGDIQLENSKMRLLFDEESGFMKSVTKKNSGKAMHMSIKFGAYKSSQFHSGAYLFRPESNDKSAEKDVLESYKEKKVLIVSGSLTSDVSVVHGPLLAHTVRIFNTKTFLDNNIYIENDIDFELPPKNRETEMFMRFQTNIENGENPEFYSDLNGFQWQPREKVSNIGVEGNYFPITTSAFIQDDKVRLTIVTTHAQGAASLEPGQLEVMLDRRTLYDDYRGMGEGIVDSRLTRHQFWVSIESFDRSSEDTNLYQLPSLQTNHLINSLNYPVNIYLVEKYDDAITLNLDKRVQLLNYNLPCDLHILNLRTLTEPNLPLFPSQSALLVLHRLAYDCRITNSVESPADDENLMTICSNRNGRFDSVNLFRNTKISQVHRTSLTGLHSHGKVKSFAEETIEPMELRTFNLTFF